MAELKIKLLNSTFATIASSRESESLATLTYFSEYKKGDLICLEVSENGAYCEIQFDDALKLAVVYISNNSIYFEVPFDDKRRTLSPKAFSGNCHVITARILLDNELNIRRNLALNPYDKFISSRSTTFPHAESNVEVDSADVFSPSNAIDGVWTNISHGKFPYQSWGVGNRDDAKWRLNFGNDVYIDELRITLRADFPHDNYWKEIVVEFSDGTIENIDLNKKIEPQVFQFKQRKISWLELKNLQKYNEASPFPALKQLEAWGSIKIS